MKERERVQFKAATPPSGLGSFLPSFWGEKKINLTVVKRWVFKEWPKKRINDRLHLGKTKKREYVRFATVPIPVFLKCFAPLSFLFAFSVRVAKKCELKKNPPLFENHCYRVRFWKMIKQKNVLMS